MSEPENVEVNTTQLTFGPQKKTSHLVITNGGDCWVTYKLKTSNPMSYVVRPRMGCIAAGATENVSISYRNEIEKEQKEGQNRFRLEVRKMTDAEQQAREARVADDTAGVQKALGISESEAQDPLTYIWKAATSLPCKKIHLECSFDSKAKAPARKEELDSSVNSKLSSDVRSVMNENDELRTTIEQLKKQKAELTRERGTGHITKEELHAKSQSGLAVPFWLFLILWGLFFYGGLSADRLVEHMPPLPPSVVSTLESMGLQ
ncbi:hypothetical protein DIPPA_15092 [Diplonema papillatum]|nr:hypothetical protein DIPPA_15092 [Diplonema papillatum]